MGMLLIAVGWIAAAIGLLAVAGAVQGGGLASVIAMDAGISMLLGGFAVAGIGYILGHVARSAHNSRIIAEKLIDIERAARPPEPAIPAAERREPTLRSLDSSR